MSPKPSTCVFCLSLCFMCEYKQDQNHRILDPGLLVTFKQCIPYIPFAPMRYAFAPSLLFPCRLTPCLGIGTDEISSGLQHFSDLSPALLPPYMSHSHTLHMLTFKARCLPLPARHGREVKSARLETAPILGLGFLQHANAQVLRTR
jgi:hypothetical protein